MLTMLAGAKAARTAVANLTENEKNQGLEAMAKALETEEEAILAANARDLENAKDHIAPVMLDRLKLTHERIAGMAAGLRQVALLPDETGKILKKHVREDGLIIEKRSVPMGVVAIIYESRPNVTADAAALALKSGNVCVLRGGKEAFLSNAAIVAALRNGLKACGITENAVNLVTDTSRESAHVLMTANGYVDLLIPRGGAGLIRACVEQATVPCIQTGTGICHLYTEKTADFDKALNIIENAKTSRPSVCNAAEVLLVDEAIAPAFLPQVLKRLVTDRAAAGKTPVELRLCEKAQRLIPGMPAGEKDFDTEFLDYILAVKVVKNTAEAIAHITAHSTGHSEAIITENEQAADAFTHQVDSAAVYVNASTRFTDGGEFGLGCEMGISTQKLHARGPMGLRELTTYQYVIRGNGHVR